MAKKETNTKSFILRIDSETMSAIEAWAEDEFRSTNGQLQWIIAEGWQTAEEKEGCIKENEGRSRFKSNRRGKER